MPTLNPISIGLCNFGQQNHVIASAPSAKTNEVNLGIIDLKCGNTAAGYIHIRKRHQKDWENFMRKYQAAFSPTAAWDDFMWFTTYQSLKNPNPALNTPRRMKDQKVCFSTPVNIRDRQGNIIASMNPTVLASENNKVVITPIPTTGNPNCH